MLVILFFCLFNNYSNSFNNQLQTKINDSIVNTIVFAPKSVENTINVFDYIPLISPIKTKYLVKISDMFGWRKHHPITVRKYKEKIITDIVEDRRRKLLKKFNKKIFIEKMK